MEVEHDFDRAEFWNRILGQYDSTDYAVYVAFFLLGAMIYFYTDVKRGMRNDGKQFNFWFMIKDNAVRFLTVLVVIFLAIRFHEPLLGIDSLNEQNCFFHGMAFDAVIGKVVGHEINNVPAVKKVRQKEISRLKNKN